MQGKILHAPWCSQKKKNQIEILQLKAQQLKWEIHQKRSTVVLNSKKKESSNLKIAR